MRWWWRSECECERRVLIKSSLPLWPLPLINIWRQWCVHKHVRFKNKLKWQMPFSNINTSNIPTIKSHSISMSWLNYVKFSAQKSQDEHFWIGKVHHATKVKVLKIPLQKIRESIKRPGRSWKEEQSRFISKSSFGYQEKATFRMTRIWIGKIL